MEEKHKQQLTEKFSEATTHKDIIILDIADEYMYMDDELISAIEQATSPYL